MKCENCDTEVDLNYCSNCGKPIRLRRIDGKYILQEIGSVFNFEKGILYTIKQLLINPGQSIYTFIHKDRNKLVKPIIFIIVTSLIYMVAQQLLHFEDGYVNSGGFEESATTKIFAWIQSNYGYANILMAIFIAGWIKVFFWKYDYNFFEILILLCFVMGIGMLFYTVFGIFEKISSLRVYQIGGLIALIYISWATGQFFDKSKKVNYVKGFFAYLLGMLTFFITAIILGVWIDFMSAM